MVRIYYVRQTTQSHIYMYMYMYMYISSVESQKGAISIFKDVPLRTRRALWLYNIYGDSALLVLNGTSLNGDSALLALNL